MVGKVGQRPVQKQLRSGRAVVLFSLGTGGIRNNRRPLDNEEPREYADRCAVQWHRVCVYPSRLGDLALKHVLPGSVLYLEGNLETKVFSDPITGLVRRIREIAIRRDGSYTTPLRCLASLDHPTRPALCISTTSILSFPQSKVPVSGPDLEHFEVVQDAELWRTLYHFIVRSACLSW